MSVERQGRMASEQGLELEVHAVHAGFHELPQKADGRCRLQIRESKKSNGNCKEKDSCRTLRAAESTRGCGKSSGGNIRRFDRSNFLYCDKKM